MGGLLVLEWREPSREHLRQSLDHLPTPIVGQLVPELIQPARPRRDRRNRLCCERGGTAAGMKNIRHLLVVGGFLAGFRVAVGTSGLASATPGATV